jgi:hypothetical protein
LRAHDLVHTLAIDHHLIGWASTCSSAKNEAWSALCAKCCVSCTSLKSAAIAVLGAVYTLSSVEDLVRLALNTVAVRIDSGGGGVRGLHAFTCRSFCKSPAIFAWSANIWLSTGIAINNILITIFARIRWQVQKLRTQTSSAVVSCSIERASRAHANVVFQSKVTGRAGVAQCTVQARLAARWAGFTYAGNRVQELSIRAGGDSKFFSFCVEDWGCLRVSWRGHG